MIERKLRELMEDYNISMLLFVHPDLGTVQLDKDRTWYIHGRKYNTNLINYEQKRSNISKLVSKLEEKIINEDYEDLLLLIKEIKEGI